MLRSDVFFNFFAECFFLCFPVNFDQNFCSIFFVFICDEDVVKSGRAEEERAAARAASPELRRFVDNRNQGREGGRRSGGDRETGGKGEGRRI